MCRNNGYRLVAVTTFERGASDLFGEFDCDLWRCQTDERIAQILGIPDWQVNELHVVHKSVIVKQSLDFIPRASTWEVFHHERGQVLVIAIVS